VHNSTLFVSCCNNSFILRGRHFNRKVKWYQFGAFFNYLMSGCVHAMPIEKDMFVRHLETQKRRYIGDNNPGFCAWL